MPHAVALFLSFILRTGLRPVQTEVIPMGNRVSLVEDEAHRGPCGLQLIMPSCVFLALFSPFFSAQATEDRVSARRGGFVFVAFNPRNRPFIAFM